MKTKRQELVKPKKERRKRERERERERENKMGEIQEQDL
jgi:hypothetical protein